MQGRTEIVYLVTTQLVAPGQSNREHHSEGRARQCCRNADTGRDLSPQNAAKRHPSHEYYDEGGEATRAHPRGQGHLSGDLERRKNRDPGEAYRQHRDCQQRDIVHVREGERGKRIERARACNQRIAGDSGTHTRQQRGARHGTDADAGEQRTVDFRALPQFPPDDKREQRPRRGSENKKRTSADEHYLQRAGMHDETHAHAHRTEKAFRRQRALAMHAPPPQQHHGMPT